MGNSNQIAVIGLGNLLLQDEGAGIHAIRSLQNNYIFDPQISIIDGGTSGFDLLPFFENHQKIIIIDTINFQKEPGFLGSYQNDDILRLFNKKMSLHQLGLSDLLGDLKLHEIYPEELYLVGIQPLKMDIGLNLSELIYAKLDDIISIVLHQLNNWGINHSYCVKAPLNN